MKETSRHGALDKSTTAKVLGVDLNAITHMAAQEIEKEISARNLRRAFDLANLSLGKGLSHSIFHYARSLLLRENEDTNGALVEAEQAVFLAPSSFPAAENLGLCLLDADRAAEAVEALKAAIELKPHSAAIYNTLGHALSAAGDHSAAYYAHAKAAEIDPQLANALASLASISAREGKSDAAYNFAKQALALDPHQMTAIVALALLEISEKRFYDAELRLRDLIERDDLPSNARPSILGLLGDALDGQRRYDEAFAAYQSENGELKGQYSSRFAGNRSIAAANHMNAYFESAAPSLWQGISDTKDADRPKEHIFLLGFMRSGTTLLEQVLASSDQLIALEEKGLLNGLGEQFLTSVPALNSLARLGIADARKAQDQYWDRARKHSGQLAGKIFVDKQPLNTIKLPIIAKIFPDAKIIFALRDPRDVVFSCFRRHFRVNVTMYEFLDLPNAAKLYSAIMQLADTCRGKFNLNLLEHRYEAMVHDFDNSISAVCKFIGLEWSDDMRRFDRFASSVDIRSPSAMQVRQPLYNEGVGHWRHYADKMQLIYPILEPWIKAFGYFVE